MKQKQNPILKMKKKKTKIDISGENCEFYCFELFLSRDSKKEEKKQVFDWSGLILFVRAFGFPFVVLINKQLAFFETIVLLPVYFDIETDL